MQIIWTVHHVISWLFVFQFLFSITQTHTQNLIVFLQFSHGHLTTNVHIQNKIRNNWHLIKTLSFQEMMREKYIEWKTIYIWPKTRMKKLKIIFSQCKTKEKCGCIRWQFWKMKTCTLRLLWFYHYNNNNESYHNFLCEKVKRWLVVGFHALFLKVWKCHGKKCESVAAFLTQMKLILILKIRIEITFACKFPFVCENKTH